MTGNDIITQSKEVLYETIHVYRYPRFRSSLYFQFSDVFSIEILVLAQNIPFHWTKVMYDSIPVHIIKFCAPSFSDKTGKCLSRMCK